MNRLIILILGLTLVAASCNQQSTAIKSEPAQVAGAVEVPATGSAEPKTEPETEAPNETKSQTAPQKQSFFAKVADLVTPKTEEEQDTQIDQNTMKNVEQDGKLEEHENRIGNLENVVNNPPPPLAPTPAPLPPPPVPEPPSPPNPCIAPAIFGGSSLASPLIFANLETCVNAPNGRWIIKTGNYLPTGHQSVSLKVISGSVNIYVSEGYNDNINDKRNIALSATTSAVSYRSYGSNWKELGNYSNDQWIILTFEWETGKVRFKAVAENGVTIGTTDWETHPQDAFGGFKDLVVHTANGNFYLDNLE